MKKIFWLALMVLSITLIFSSAFFYAPKEAYAVPSPPIVTTVTFAVNWRDTIVEYPTLTKITFASAIPDGYVADGRTISSDITVYVDADKATDMAFVSGYTIFAPEDSSNLFFNCNAATAIEFFNFDTSNVNNMNNMFFACRALESLDLSDFNTSNVADMSSMFYNCWNLANLDLSNFNTNLVTDMNSMFAFCSNNTNITFGSSFSTGNVEDMHHMFYACTSLVTLDLSSFDTSNVADMSYMFHSCQSLESLDLSSFDTSNVITMRDMFFACRALESLDLSDFNTSNVADMSYMFHSCRSLDNLDLSSFDTSNVNHMRQMFFNCISLEGLDLSNFDTSNVADMREMFYGCMSLESLDLSNFDTSNVADMAYLFFGCSSLLSLNMSNFDMSACTNVDFMFAFCESLKVIYAPYNVTLPIELHGNFYNNQTFTQITSENCSSIDGEIVSAAVFYKTYNITFHENSGTFLSGYAKPLFYIFASELSLPTSINIMRNEHKFLGWTATNLATDTDYINAISDSDSGNKVFYAKWQLKDEVSINEQIQTKVYNGVTKSFEITGTDLFDFAVMYSTDTNWTATAPIGAGSYNVRITRNEDEDYLAFDKIINNGLVIQKANYDISNVAFADKTVKADGDAHSIIIDGTLPIGLSVHYEGNNQTNGGNYTITAIFTGDWSNYNNVANMTATLKLLMPELSKTTEENTTEMPDVVIESDEGFDPDLEIIISIIPADSLSIAIDQNSSVAKAYSLQLVKGDESVSLNNSVTVRLLIPVEITNKDFRLYSGQNQITYTIVEDYAVFDIDTLSNLTFVYDNEQGSLLWLIILLIVILLAEISLAVYKILKDKKSKTNPKTYSFAPLLLAALIPAGHTIAVIILAVMCLLGGAMNAYLFFLKDRLSKKQKTEEKSDEIEDIEKDITLN